MLPVRTCLIHKDTHRLKVQGSKHASGKGKQTSVAILISDKIDFNTCTNKIIQEVYHIMINDQFNKEK